jgi:hypothetical protein
LKLEVIGKATNVPKLEKKQMENYQCDLSYAFSIIKKLMASF